jgi:hypothetical protein
MGNLVFRAGKTAIKMILDGGLNPDAVKAVGGAAGGPKWLIMSHLDRALFASWFAGRKRPLFLVGSSSGAWRFASVCMADPIAALERFQKAYIHQYYFRKPTPIEVSRQGRRILNSILEKNGVHEIVSHPFLRLNVMCVRCRGLTAFTNNAAQGAGLLMAALANLIKRKFLKLFFERALFYDPRDKAPFFAMNDFPIQRIALTPQNAQAALMASGSIPMVMAGVCAIDGAPEGVYRDGALIDYHMDLPYEDFDGIFLLPHYCDRIISGWLDKHLKWRCPSPENLDRMLVVAPSAAFLQKLPYQKIPDRSDFKTFFGQDRKRLAYWYSTVDLSRALADEFMEAVLSKSIQRRVIPI